jgi:DNA repair exonuclease SbcCD ATPase subunit
MADLEAAATDALDKVKALATEVEEARQLFAAQEGRLTELRTRLLADWARVDEGARALAAVTTEQSEQLAKETEEAGTALLELKGDAGQAVGQGASELEASQEHTAAFAERFPAGEAELTRLRDTVREAAQAFGDQAASVAEDLELALGKARDFVATDVVDGLQALQEEIAERGEAVATALDECEQQLEESYDAWADGLDQVDATLEATFGELADALTRNADTAFAYCEDAWRAAVETAAARVREVETLLGDLQESAASGAEAAGTAATLGEGLDESARGALSVRGKLDEVKALLASFTFVQV